MDEVKSTLWWPTYILAMALLSFAVSHGMSHYATSGQPVTPIAEPGLQPPDKNDAEVKRLEGEILRRIEQRDLFLTRKQWPIESQPRASLNIQGRQTTLPISVEVLTCDDQIIATDWLGSVDRPDPTWRDRTFPLPCACWRNGAFHLKVRLTGFDETDEKVILSDDHPVEVPVEFVERINQVVESVEDREVAEAVRTRTKITLVPFQEHWLARMKLFDEFIPRDLAFGVDVLFFDGDACIGRTGFYCNEQIRSSTGQSNVFARVESSMKNLEPGKAIEAIIISNPSLALRDFDAKKYWAGGCRVKATISE